jgi:hypothetical protein
VEGPSREDSAFRGWEARLVKLVKGISLTGMLKRGFRNPVLVIRHEIATGKLPVSSCKMSMICSLPFVCIYETGASFLDMFYPEIC